VVFVLYTQSAILAYLEIWIFVVTYTAITSFLGKKQPKTCW